MKHITLLATLACVFGGSFTRAADSVPAPAVSSGRVGVYDSRVIAYAHFWSEPVTRERDALVARAKAAKAAGAQAELETYEKQIRDEQKRSHAQVFSTAPAKEALAALAPRLPALLRELGVERLVSKWDDAALRSVPEANRLDVTDRLVSEFMTPSEKQRKTIEAMKTAKPVSTRQAQSMLLPRVR